MISEEPSTFGPGLESDRSGTRVLENAREGDNYCTSNFPNLDSLKDRNHFKTAGFEPAKSVW